MKLITFLLIILLGLAGVLYDLKTVPTSSNIAPQIVDVKNLQKSPNIEFTTLDGKADALEGLKEPLILLNFWASWCVPCLEELPAMLKLVDEFEGKIALLAVSIDERESDIRKFHNRLQKVIKTPVKGDNIYWVWDKDKQISLKSFNTIRVPETIIIDKERRMVKKVIGYLDWESEEVKEMLRYYAL